MYCVLDTETVGGASQPTGIYHLGGFIHNRKGEIIACFNYLIAEHFDEIRYDDYGKKNFDLYLQMVESGDCTMIDTEQNAVAMVNALCNLYNVNVMTAFNSGFDYVKTYCRELLAGREFIDLWLMALETICQKKGYKKWCAENGKLNTKGTTCRTTAETVFGYITDNPNYIEEHTALQDSLIELAIFNACIKSHKAFTKNCHCWDYPNKFWLFPRPQGRHKSAPTARALLQHTKVKNFKKN